MKFDVTHLNLKDLLRALVANAKPKGFGEKIYEDSIDRGENVQSVSEEEMAVFFSEFDAMTEGMCRIVDYYKGMPIKLDLTKNDNGQIIASSTSYDVAHGAFEYLKTLLTYFVLDEIIIIDRSTHHSVDFGQDISHQEHARFLKTFVEDANRVAYEFGYYWKLDPRHRCYESFRI